MLSIARRRKPTFLGSNKYSAGVGLRILTQISCGDSNVLLKTTLKFNVPNTSSFHDHSSRKSNDVNEFCCFLKSCCLCRKPLSSDDDVYMYKGDQGFCSIECRSRQIIMDEMEEEAALIKKKFASSTADCHATGRPCETCELLQEFRPPRRRKQLC
ncbi:hypothetical protein Nepgr_005679 [Nepenthes gracilis]|uniref:FLZ-type domain-containing protein n=1 Tax=Nepenthes gracilis TaxID=150966 RepID=A0AAD3XGN8_NEPGR|nr:hypothetical protein Nepgr_005679 [Nepenthes gracilis]